MTQSKITLGIRKGEAMLARKLRPRVIVSDADARARALRANEKRPMPALARDMRTATTVIDRATGEERAMTRGERKRYRQRVRSVR